MDHTPPDDPPRHHARGHPTWRFDRRILRRAWWRAMRRCEPGPLLATALAVVVLSDYSTRNVADDSVDLVRIHGELSGWIDGYWAGYLACLSR
jgi:hypothetical protein